MIAVGAFGWSGEEVGGEDERDGKIQERHARCLGRGRLAVLRSYGCIW